MPVSGGDKLALPQIRCSGAVGAVKRGPRLSRLQGEEPLPQEFYTGSPIHLPFQQLHDAGQADTSQHPLGDIAEVFQQVPSIRDLDRPGSAERGCVGVEPGAIPAYDLHSRVGGKPLDKVLGSCLG